jgi:hypothetical protein
MFIKNKFISGSGVVIHLFHEGGSGEIVKRSIRGWGHSSVVDHLPSMPNLALVSNTIINK